MSTGSFGNSADPQRVVDEIQAFLNGADLTLNEPVLKLAEDYSACCSTVNERLRRCHEHLRASLWTEAIQLAEAEPKLIDVASILNFDRRAEWDDLCLLYDELATPQAIMMDVYDELNEAYNHYTPLESLFIRHRNMALKRSPVRDRLKVMRHIAERDEQATFWEEDIVAFEQVLLDEIRQDARAATERLDEETLKNLQQELASPDWFEPPSDRVVQPIKKAIKRVAQARSRNQLPELTDRLLAHWEYHAQNYRLADPLHLEHDANWKATQQLIAQWFKDAEHCGLLDTDPLFVAVQPIDQEVRNLEQNIVNATARGAAIDDFQSVLRNPKSNKRQLESAFLKLQEYGVVPTGDRVKYDKKLKQLWWKTNWEKVVGGGIFLVLVLAFLIFSAVMAFS